VDKLLLPFKSGNLVILGKRGSGKSTLAVAAGAFRRSGLLVDTLGDLPFGRPVTFAGLAGFGDKWRRLNMPAEAVSLHVGIDVLAGGSFAAVLKLAKADILPNPFTLLVDEVDAYGSAAYNNVALRELARYGRHWGVAYIVTARRYAEIPKDWTSGADLILMGPSLDPQDAAMVERIIGGAYMAIWRNLRPYNFFGISLDGPAIYVYDSVERSIQARSL
jgi:hypothetical protein